MIERTFGVLKAHFPIYKEEPHYRFDVQVQPVITLAALYNMIRDFNNSLVDIFDIQADGKLRQGAINREFRLVWQAGMIRCRGRDIQSE